MSSEMVVSEMVLGEAMRGLASAVAAWGPAVANHLWQSTVFGVAAGVLTLALRKNRAASRYWLWLAASLKFAVPFALLMAVGERMTAPKVVVPAVSHVYFAMEPLEQPFVAQEAFVPNAVTYAPTALSWWEVLPVGLLVLWVCGVGFVLVRWCVRWIVLRRIVRAAVVAREGREVETLRRLEEKQVLRVAQDETQRQMRGSLHYSGDAAFGRDDDFVAGYGKSGRVELRLSSSAMGPGIVGVWRPVLLWPAGISGRLTDEHIEAIVAHELTHVKRRDNLTAALHMVVEAMFWFHPLVWWAGRQMMEERERACDEAAVELGAEPRAYAESILRVCEFCLEAPLACVSGISAAGLKARLREIMSGRARVRLSWAQRVGLVCAACVAVAAPVLSGQGRAMERLAQKAMPEAVLARIMPVVKAASGPVPLEMSAPLAMQIENSSTADTGFEAYVPTMTFEVASVRESRPDMNAGFTVSGGFQPMLSSHFNVTNFDIDNLLAGAYFSAGYHHVEGIPEVFRKDRLLYNVQAKANQEDDEKLAKLPKKERELEQEHMVRQLLEDRFKLKAHWETREGDVYNLVAPKGDAKLREGVREPISEELKKAWAERGVPPIYQRGGTVEYDRGYDFVAHDASIQNIIGIISEQFGRPVFDKTGLTGRYNFVLSYKGARERDRKADDPSPRQPLETAVQDVLGLKLEPAKGPVKVLVIDDLERPASVDGAEVQAQAAGMRLVSFPQEKMVEEKGGSEAGVMVLNPHNEMVPAPPLKFDVVSMRPVEAPGARYTSTKVDIPANGDGLAWHGATLLNVITFAYSFHGGTFQVTGEPKWADDTHYEIQAKVAPEDVAAWQKATLDQQREMVQVLLADVLKLKVHVDTKEYPVYALKVAKDGPKLTEWKPGDKSAWGGGEIEKGEIGWWLGPDRMIGQKANMGSLAGSLSQRMGRTVVNKTELGAKAYNFELPLSIYRAMPGEPNMGNEETDASVAATFAALKKLGLELVPDKATVAGVVIDRIEKPATN